MSHTSQINLLPKNNNTVRLLRIAVSACLGVSAVMVWAIVWEPGGQRSATIGTNLDGTPEISESPADEPVRKPHALSVAAVTAPALGPESDSVSYYESKTGKSFRVNLRTSKTEVLSATPLPGFLGTIWSPSRHEVVSSFDISGSRVLKYFDYTSGRSSVVGTAATAVAFSPDGRRLAYIDTVDGQSAVYIGSADGSDARKIIALRAEDPALSWPEDSALFFASRRPGGNRSDLMALTPDGKLSALIPGKEMLEYTWSRDGKKLLFSYFGGERVELWYLDMGTGGGLQLPISTGAHKCAWTPDSATILCGVPPEGSLTRDVPSERTATRDDIIAVDISLQTQEVVYAAQKDILLGVASPLVSSSGTFLVFINSFDQRLYRLPLP